MFEWSEEDLMVRDAVRSFVDKEIRPHSDELESGQLPPYDILRKLMTSFGVDAMAREGLEKELDAEAAGESKSKGSGGSGGGMMNSMALILNMELAAASLGMVVSMGVSVGLTVSTIRSKGTLAQKKRWLPELVTLEKVGAWAITEPDSGSDALGGMKTTVRRDGDGYILNGQKTFITNGPYADTIVVFAKLDEGDGTPMRERKVLTFVLDKGMEGLTQGKPFKKMGIMSSPTGELFFDNVRLGRDRLLGETEDVGSGSRGDSGVKAGFTAERIGIAALSMGIINEAQRLSIEYAKSRTLWGQEIGKFQLIQLKLAEMEIARINVQNMLFNALERAKAGKPLSLAEASAMKLYSSRAATEVAMEAVQLFGGNGYMTEYRVEQLARDAKSLMIYAGSNEIQVTHVAKGLLA
ncbi:MULTISPECIES: acyl-CoA dehydrogenase family protein [unclassified Gordonia (in: high G+C Gram-positive bacteria)]|uniref:acyl-CoA dehydrogenase family protein n=1 Tax=unclassified Gordonia (in: high G+C Gram-positive bacteria) TaxID=2657482 RepID=UPI0007EC29A4|nr:MULTISPECIES: acyl-CoA dehydrogenase family protein [unclassified Gordonia (in: high G+C Gram-positive bacteria)]OBA37639.1 acyl-CoA dehydrogenase [Gordonia sp. 852002-51296_SCH5728562-b]OBA56845.1 acyl-CoA dehydrogenase [Gordonia sp. 852002-10350_SCH5691597]